MARHERAPLGALDGDDAVVGAKLAAAGDEGGSKLEAVVFSLMERAPLRGRWGMIFGSTSAIAEPRCGVDELRHRGG